MLPTISTKPDKHILKPWWDVFTDYISVFMMIIAVFGIYLQVTRESMTCLPCKWVNIKQCKAPATTNITMVYQKHRIASRNKYSSAFCYEKKLHWFAKYFPYLMFVHTIVFMACGKFLFTILSTSSTLENFVTILLKCDDSPWTTRALSETMVGESNPKSFGKAADMRDDGAKPRIEANVLCKKDGEQAKALFEKVKKYRIKVEKGDTIYTVYIWQTVVKITDILLIIIYPIYYVDFIEFSLICEENIAGYSAFTCIYTLANSYKILAWAYIILGVLCFLSCLYTLYWMCTRSLKSYSFETTREESSYSDIPDMVNDFAFMLHLIDQYNPLYTDRFAVFLSEVSEKKLKQMNLDNEWKLEKLSQHITKNVEDKLELHLFKLAGIPNTVFELKELEVLKLEFMRDILIPPMVIQLSNLTEVWLYHTPTKIDPPALSFLGEKLGTLHVTFTHIKEIPRWMYHLKNLHELHLTGTLGSHLTSVIDMLRELKMLKVLYLTNKLTKLPLALLEVCAHLQKLSIKNSGTKLMDLINMRKSFSVQFLHSVEHLKELELIECNLEQIPHAIISVRDLRELDLRGNNLTIIDAIIGFQHLKWLVCLKLWYNKIVHIPIQIGSLSRLQRLYLNNNKIEKIPQELFFCQNLRLLDLSHNMLMSISANVGCLQRLQHFAVTANMVGVGRFGYIDVDLFEF